MNADRRGWSSSLAAIVLLCIIGPAQAGPCLVSDPASGFTGCTYYQSPVPVVYPTAPVVTLDRLRLRNPMPPGPPPAIDSFFDVFVTIDLGPAVQYSGSAHAETNPSLWTLSPGSPVPIELLQLNLVGLPPQIMLRESPVLVSQGLTEITDEGGGLYRIDSFFDVFTELSLDNGQTWIPGGPLRLDLSATVPEPGVPGLLGLGLAALLLMRRRVAVR